VKHREHIPPELAVRRADPGKDPNALVVQLAGDWLGRAHLPDVSTVTKELAGGGATALEFETKELGCWDSALMVRILAIHDACAKAGIEFRAQTLPAGLAKLIALAQAVPEKSDAARKEVKPTFLERVGESGLAAWTGGRAMLSFLGESFVSLLKLFRGRAQFRVRDLVEVVEACGPQALGIVALINFLVGLILAFVGANEMARFGASLYTADLVAVATVREMGAS
jgi:phospholipid/cholesterol/gamma-HCH transport system permease protein